jgi:hypothetical protein
MLKIQAGNKLDINFFSFISLIFVKFRIACCSSVVYDEDSFLLSDVCESSKQKVLLKKNEKEKK